MFYVETLNFYLWLSIKREGYVEFKPSYVNVCLLIVDYGLFESILKIALACFIFTKSDTVKSAIRMPPMILPHFFYSYS
jgi:hypothetical protein